MKTAISIPDEVFEEGEILAKKLGISRSELYVQALKKLVAQMGHVHITETLNRVYAKIDSRMDEGLARAQSRALGRDKW